MKKKLEASLKSWCRYCWRSDTERHHTAFCSEGGMLEELNSKREIGYKNILDEIDSHSNLDSEGHILCASKWNPCCFFFYVSKWSWCHPYSPIYHTFLWLPRREASVKTLECQLSVSSESLGAANITFRMLAPTSFLCMGMRRHSFIYTVQSVRVVILGQEVWK